jgi:hypothetical protein
MSDLRTRIAALVAYELVRQAETRNEYWYKYTPLDDAGNDLPELIGLDTSIDPSGLADAVIAELQPELKSLDRLAQWQAAPRLPIHTQNREADDE